MAALDRGDSAEITGAAKGWLQSSGPAVGDRLHVLMIALDALPKDKAAVLASALRAAWRGREKAAPPAGWSWVALRALVAGPAEVKVYEGQLRQRAMTAGRQSPAAQFLALWRCWGAVRQRRWLVDKGGCAGLEEKVVKIGRTAPTTSPARSWAGLASRLLAHVGAPAGVSGTAAAGRLLEALRLGPLDVVAARQLLAGSAPVGPKVVQTVLRSVGALRRAGFVRWALALAQQAGKRAPNVAAVRVAEADCLLALGKRDLAVGALRRAAGLDKGNVALRLRLARLLRGQDLLGAIRVLEQATAIDPAHEGARAALRELRAELAARRPKKRRERLTEIDGKRLRLWFTSHGGIPRAIVIKGEKYQERSRTNVPSVGPWRTDKKLRKQVNLVRTWSEYWLPLRLYFVGNTFGFPSWNDDQDWERVRLDGASGKWRPVKSGEPHAVRQGKVWVFGYRWPVHYPGMEPPAVEVVRSYRIDPDDLYAWDMEVRVINRTNRKQRVQLAMQVPTYDRLSEDRSFFNPISLMKEAVCLVGDSVRMQTLPALFGGTSGCMGCDASSCACRRSPAKGERESRTIEAISSHERWMNFSGTVRWFGVDEMYFLLAAATEARGEAVCTLLGRDMPGKKWGVLAARWVGPAEVLLKRDSELVRRFKVFSGPKIQEVLDEVRVGSSNAKLGEAVDYGFFWVIGRPMIWLMKRLHTVVGNWGLAIILLTLLIKLLTLPLTMKQMRSMKGMAKLKPQLDALKEKYGDDKQRFQQEMWNLYKAHKINPLGGCLPMLIQMPIYIAWYQALMVSVDLYNAPLFGWITDLTKPDAVNIAGIGIPILPLIMGATMFLQQRMTPTTVDSAQQKMMLYMMPAMFTFFMLFLPSGLTLYILTNTLLTMAHQWYMNHSE